MTGKLPGVKRVINKVISLWPCMQLSYKLVIFPEVFSLL